MKLSMRIFRYVLVASLAGLCLAGIFMPFLSLKQRQAELAHRLDKVLDPGISVSEADKRLQGIGLSLPSATMGGAAPRWNSYLNGEPWTFSLLPFPGSYRMKIEYFIDNETLTGWKASYETYDVDQAFTAMIFCPAGAVVAFLLLVYIKKRLDKSSGDGPLQRALKDTL